MNSTAKLVIGVLGGLVAVLATMVVTMGSAWAHIATDVSALKAFRDGTESRLERIELKVDRLIERPG